MKLLGPLQKLQIHHWLMAAALATGLLSGLVQHSTYALLTSAQIGGAGEFIAGTVTLSSPSVQSGSLSLSSLWPGDTSNAILRVQNTGDVTLKYRLSNGLTPSTSDPNNLAGTMQVTIRSSSCSGTVIYPTNTLLNGGFGGSINGNDQTLGPGSTQDICLSFQLPSSASSGMANSTADLTYTFSAIQASGQ